MKGAGHKVQTSSYKIRKLGHVTDSTVIIVNSIVLYISQVAERDFKSSHHKNQSSCDCVR